MSGWTRIEASDGRVVWVRSSQIVSVEDAVRADGTRMVAVSVAGRVFEAVSVDGTADDVMAKLGLLPGADDDTYPACHDCDKPWADCQCGPAR